MSSVRSARGQARTRSDSRSSCREKSITAARKSREKSGCGITTERPSAGREIQYQLADDRLHTGTTNAAGELAFEFPTRRFSESQALALTVVAPEHNLRTVERIAGCPRV